MTTGYEGRVILVTGANSGIGEAIAVAFQQTGATVFGLARRREALEAARARHPQIHWRRGDVTDAIKACTAVENAVGTKKECRSIDKREMTASRGRLTRRRSGSMKEVKIVATA
jgi:NADP-dependent 3-hydroxy acid dehydrogenase YdfG